MSAEQKVITIDDISADNAPIIYVAGGLDKFFAAVEAEVSGEVPDLSTAKSRARIASLSAKVSSSKAAVEKPGREYLKRLKEMPKTIEVELAAWVKKMDALRDSTRKPLTDWEAAETKRKDDHIDTIDRMKAHAENLDGLIAEDLADRIEKVEAVALGKHWEEFEADAGSFKDSTLVTLRTTLASRQKYEAEQAELTRLRAEAEAQAQRDRDAEIARAAVEQAQRDAEAKALAERQAAAAREQALIDQAAQAQREADQKARDAEAAVANQALQLQLQAEQAERSKIKAEADRLAAIQQAEQERIAAEERQAQAVEWARLDEIAKQNKAADEIIRQQNLREADLEHRRIVNRAALDAFIAGGMTSECAKQAITLIASHAIPAVTITY